MPPPLKGQSACPSVPVDTASTKPNVGAIPSPGPMASGGAQAMLAITVPCQCPATQCCGGGDDGDGIGGLPSGPGGIPQFFG